MGQNNQMLAQKALAYCICLDIVRTALDSIGSINSVSDGSKVTTIIYDEVVKASQDQIK